MYKRHARGKRIYSGGRQAGKARTRANKSVRGRSQAHVKPRREERRRANCSRLHQRRREERDHPSGAISFHQSLISLLRVVQHLVTPGGNVNGAAGSPNEDKSYPKWRPYLFPAPPFALLVPFFPTALLIAFAPGIAYDRSSVRHFPLSVA